MGSWGFRDPETGQVGVCFEAAAVTVTLVLLGQVMELRGREGETAMFVLLGEAVVGMVGVADPVKETTPAAIKALHEAGFRVIMATGDGVNDAPALAQADAGIAMRTGADVAIESAGFTLVNGNLDDIARVRGLARATMRNIRQNLFFALIYNASGVPIAASILYPFFGILLASIFAAFAMSASFISVVRNALRLRTTRV